VPTSDSRGNEQFSRRQGRGRDPNDVSSLSGLHDARIPNRVAVTSSATAGVSSVAPTRSVSPYAQHPTENWL
jgi:hypothetical protein